MPIIDIKDNLLKFRFPMLKIKIFLSVLKNRCSRSYLLSSRWLPLTIYCLGFLFLSGCSAQKTLNQAQYYINQSETYYRAAVAEYKKIISQGKDLDRLHFQLGQLYYSHGEFDQAIKEFKNSNEKEAKKLLAISYYWLGSFTDALEIFNKNEVIDDEYLYYCGLTAERLNLYGQAQEAYNKITQQPYQELARQRIDKISQLNGKLDLKDLEPDLQKIILEAPECELYPQAGALILLSDENIAINKDDTAVYQGHFIVKILNERGKKDFSEVVIGYDSTYEKVELIYARTITPGGAVVSVGAKHIRDVSKYLNFPLYSNARAFIISMPEITEGALIEYKVKIHRNRLINQDDFVVNYRLQENEPIIAANFEIIFPQAKKVNIKMLNEDYNNFNAKLKPEVIKDENRTIYKWNFKNIPQIIPEPHMPPEVQINPAMMVSTFESWEEIYKWWWDLAKDKIESSGQINDKVEELIAGKKTEEEKIRSIYNFCAKEIRYVAVEYGQAGYEPHKAEEIFINKYGDCKDQAVLLVTMLKQAGFKAYPVLIGTKDYYDLGEDFPSVLFNHCIAAVERGEEIVFLDPTGEVCPFMDLPAGDQGRRVLLFKEDGYRIETTPFYPSEHNKIEHDIDIKINEQEEIIAQKKVFAYGYYEQAQRFWLLYTQPELIQQSLKEKIQEISIGSELIDYRIKNINDLDKNVVLEYDFKGPEYWTAAGSLRILPQLTAQIESSLVAKDKRKYPIDFNLLETKEIIFNISFPPIFKVKYLPQDIYIDKPWLEFEAKYSLKDNRINFIEKTKIKRRFVLPSEYLEFKNFYLDLVKKIKQRIVLEKE